MNEACSTYRGTFRPADVVCDIPYEHELQITVAQPPLRATPAGAKQAATRSICRTSDGPLWWLACDLPSDRELIIPIAQPSASCELQAVYRLSRALLTGAPKRLGTFFRWGITLASHQLSIKH
jgi:hypothetical protein